MPRVVAVTTFAKDHIDLYGKEFIERFKNFWNIPLFVFAEDFTSNDIGHPVLNYYDLIPEQQIFKDRLNYIETPTTKSQNRLAKALRWSYKSFVIWYALKNIKADYIVWIDADVKVLTTVPKNIVEEVNGETLMTVYPQHINKEEDIHIESGLIIFNKKHNLISKVIDHYEEGYHNLKVLDIDKPWDGYWLARLLKVKRIKKRSTVLVPPFQKFKPYLYHNVGKDKFKNTSLNKYSGRN